MCRALLDWLARLAPTCKRMHRKHPRKPRQAVRAVILYFDRHGHPITGHTMTQIIPTSGVSATVTLLDAAGVITTKFPEGAAPVWSTDRPDAFTLAPGVSGLSVVVAAVAESAAAGVLAFALGNVTATAAIQQAGVAPAPAPTPEPAPAPTEPGVAVSAVITFAPAV